MTISIPKLADGYNGWTADMVSVLNSVFNEYADALGQNGHEADVEKNVTVDGRNVCIYLSVGDDPKHNINDIDFSVWDKNNDEEPMIASAALPADIIKALSDLYDAAVVADEEAAEAEVGYENEPDYNGDPNYLYGQIYTTYDFI